MEQLAQSQAGSNSASFFLYRRAKFIEQDRENRMQKEEDERKRKVEAGQKAALNKAETDKKLLKNQMKRLKKKQRHENYEKRLRGEVTEPPKKMVRNESAVKAVAATGRSLSSWRLRTPLAKAGARGYRKRNEAPHTPHCSRPALPDT